MDPVILIILLLICGIGFGLFGAWICGEKGRDRGPGMLIGFLFGPLGCLILALLPPGDRERERKLSEKGKLRRKGWGPEFTERTLKDAKTEEDVMGYFE